MKNRWCCLYDVLIIHCVANIVAEPHISNFKRSSLCNIYSANALRALLSREPEPHCKPDVPDFGTKPYLTQDLLCVPNENHRAYSAEPR
jgi:hypothetical protein